MKLAFKACASGRGDVALVLPCPALPSGNTACLLSSEREQRASVATRALIGSRLRAFKRALCAACVLLCGLQEVVVPKKFCDDRVQVLQADARTIPPALLAQYAPEVRLLRGPCSPTTRCNPALQAQPLRLPTCVCMFSLHAWGGMRLYNGMCA